MMITNTRMAAEQMMLESDRGCVLIGAAMLDEALEAAIRRYLNSEPYAVAKAVKPLFQTMGPLSSFASKAKVAFALRIVDEPVFRDLEVIRSLRNSFAHQQDTVDLSDTRIGQQVASLRTTLAEFEALPRFAPSGDHPISPRLRDALIEESGMVKRTKAQFAVCVASILRHLNRAGQTSNATAMPTTA